MVIVLLPCTAEEGDIDDNIGTEELPTVTGRLDEVPEEDTTLILAVVGDVSKDDGTVATRRLEKTYIVERGVLFQ
jgi:hypothetical protein